MDLDAEKLLYQHLELMKVVVQRLSMLEAQMQRIAPQDIGRILSPREAAEITGLHEKEIRRRCRAGDIPSTRTTDTRKGRYEIPLEGLKKHLAKQDKIAHTWIVPD